MVLRGVQTMVPDHGFARVGTIQVQAIMPPLTKALSSGSLQLSEKRTSMSSIEAQKPTQNPDIPKKHRVHANFFEKFARTFAFFPVTRVRNPTEIVQKNLFK